MSENSGNNNTTINGGGLGLSLLIIMFYGDPDIADALIHFLMRAAQ